MLPGVWHQVAIVENKMTSNFHLLQHERPSISIVSFAWMPLDSRDMLVEDSLGHRSVYLNVFVLPDLQR